MSFSAILKADIKKQNAEALAEFLSKGGQVRRVPTPTFYSESLRFMQGLHKTTQNAMRRKIEASTAKTLAKKALPKGTP